MSRRDIIDAYDDEVGQTHADLDEGRITIQQHKQFMENLTNNLNSDLDEFDRGEQA